MMCIVINLEQLIAETVYPLMLWRDSYPVVEINIRSNGLSAERVIE